MGEISDYINGILLENIDKEIPINFSLPAIPAKDTSSVSKSSTISKLENYIDENYDKAAKIQLKQTILREVKQQLTCETKEKGHLDRLPWSLHNQVSPLKIEIGYLRKEMKKNNVIRTLFRQNSYKCKGSSPCESRQHFWKKRRTSQYLYTSNPIPSDNECQFTKLTKRKSRVRDTQTY